MASFVGHARDDFRSRPSFLAGMFLALIAPYYALLFAHGDLIRRSGLGIAYLFAGGRIGVDLETIGVEGVVRDVGIRGNSDKL